MIRGEFRCVLREFRVVQYAISSKSSLEIFYFSQGTNHQEFSVPLQRRCRLVPLQNVSSLRNAAKGSKLELSHFLLATPRI